MPKELFTHINRKVDDLITQVENGTLGLPELQRGFVWQAAKVRDLLDSMMKGFPIGYLMIWDSANDSDKNRQIGTDGKKYGTPKSLVIDGQQRLTSLFAVMRGKKIIDDKFNEKSIIISFNPLTRILDVGNNAIMRSAEWIYDISEVFLNKTKSFNYITQKIRFISDNRIKNGSVLSDDEIEIIQQNIGDLLSLLEYSIPTLEIKGDTDEENVAEIFVRVNSGGKNLGQDDFILTLVSVYWQEGRDKIEKFCRSAKIPNGTAYNNLLFEPSPNHIVRIATTFGLKRARLYYAYLILRGRDLKSGISSDKNRDEQFDIFKTAMEKVLNSQNWHDFIKCVESAGYVSKSLISSENAIVYSYVMYLIGKYDYDLKEPDLRKIISKWFFMCSISGYYTGSPETDMDVDLADMRGVKTGKEFIVLLENKISGEFTQDYFNISLVNALENSSPRNLAWLGYCASLNILEAKVLFSNLSTRSLFSNASKGTKNALERHHLFPKEYLKKIGISDDRDRNQTANFAFIEWFDNIEISDKSPFEYMQDYSLKIPKDEKEKIYELHALFNGWENIDYLEFLEHRRILMAEIIKKGYEKL